MFGLLLRSELIQSSAVRTWNCVTNIAHFVWFKLNNIRRPVMPRSRRRHHSRSRSRSHSHERDREAKRRRLESPDSSHHRRSVSVDSETPERTLEETNKIENEKIQKCIKQGENEKSGEPTTESASEPENKDIHKPSNEANNPETMEEQNPDQSNKELNTKSENIESPPDKSEKNDEEIHTLTEQTDTVELNRSTSEKIQDEKNDMIDNELCTKDSETSSRNINSEISDKSEAEVKSVDTEVSNNPHKNEVTQEVEENEVVNEKSKPQLSTEAESMEVEELCNESTQNISEKNLEEAKDKNKESELKSVDSEVSNEHKNDVTKEVKEHEAEIEKSKPQLSTEAENMELKELSNESIQNKPEKCLQKVAKVVIKKLDYVTEIKSDVETVEESNSKSKHESEETAQEENKQEGKLEEPAVNSSTETKYTDAEHNESDSDKSATVEDSATETEGKNVSSKKADEITDTDKLSTTDESILKTPDNTPNKQVVKTSSRKKPFQGRLRVQEDRDKKRQQERENKEKIRQERKEQRIKERQEKEEQKKKEKLEKEEQKRKEKEEKDEQKRKEREEKEEQRRKEREEKEEQRRKEKEEKELKRLQELEKDKKKKEKESAAFVNFFVSKKNPNASEMKKTEEVSSFMPFEIKADMRLAPLTRTVLSEEQKNILSDKLDNQDDSVLYLKEIKTKTVGKTSSTWPVEDNEVIIIEDTDIGECVEEQPKISKMRAKLLKFHENKRPAYFGTWRKNSKLIKPRNPMTMDKDFFDYEVDSDDDWEEEEPGESLRGSDDEEKENESDEYEVDNDFFVPHGYLSDEEAENEENLPLTPETQKEKLKLLQMEFEEEMKSKTERIKPRLIGCIWESKLKPKIQDAITTFLEERMMIITAPIVIKKRELNKNKHNNSVKTSTPTRKQLNKELIPDFLKMIHGNTNNQMFLVNEFLNYMSTKNEEALSKVGLCAQLKEVARWRKCPDEGAMFNKFCWYVNEDVRKQYNLSLILPNNWTYTSTNIEENVAAKKKLSL